MHRINAAQHAGIPRRDTLSPRTVARYERDRQLPTSPILIGKHVVMRRPLVDGVYIEYLIMDGNTIAAKQISIPDEATCANAIKRLHAATRTEPEKHSRPNKPRAFRIKGAS
ncbi:hypothetical protein NX868_23655 [Burkholderia thailandensis]|uniref:Beta-hexosaminidase n=2 Tax=pseudomallei group TaxID=111527 RepID=A0AAW9D7D1_BURTH|nr:hypothetical protein [Burkholderia thailandensis]MCS3394175.1 hypothetical protein [Burkholderia thailandensis]MCS6427444.1 hypothetical protein [Burkholderia thailandensis]MCS6455627.1 hypothetical protein [Burkholderia thailandensis]MCS6466609.1 hypothetical protein [Burkholderia thailandensis]MCS6485259.1 hypothetical protein [Burkholderia thailandensis]